MKAAILSAPQPIAQRPLQISDVANPRLRSGHVLLRVRACGVCRTDLHIAEGELPPKQLRLIPGHQIVGEVIDGAVDGLAARLARGRFMARRDRWHLSLLHRAEWKTSATLPPSPVTPIAGGYAEYAFARNDFVFPLPPRSMTCMQRRCYAPASLAFAACASLACNPANAWASLALEPRLISRLPCCRPGSVKCMSPPEGSLIALWQNRWARIGSETKPTSRPWNWIEPLTFAPSGDVVLAALASLRKGGVVAINAIHLDRMPEFDYDRAALGRAPVAQRCQHDPRGCPRFPGAGSRHWPASQSDCLLPGSSERGPNGSEERCHRRRRGNCALSVV